MTIIDSILAKIGLMKVGEHLAWVNIAEARAERSHARENALRAEIDALRPDAEKFRAKAARDAEAKRAKQAAAKKVAG